MARSLIVPSEAQAIARRAIATKSGLTPPDIAWHLAGGFCTPSERRTIALYALEHLDDYKSNQCTVAAGFYGGLAGKQWALAAVDMEVDVESVLANLSRKDQLTVPELAAAIRLAWRRALAQAESKAGQRLKKNTEGRAIDFTRGFPNRRAAQVAGLDDILHQAWESFRAEVTQILDDYAATQSAIVGLVDVDAANEVSRQVKDRSLVAVASLVAFLDSRLRGFIIGDAPYEPQDFLAARAVISWVSGAMPAPDGYTFVDLASLGRIVAPALSTAELAVITMASVQVARSFTWEHAFYGQPTVPFEPHVDLDGQSYADRDLSNLTYWPGDHVGCKCELIPTWRVAS